MPISFYIQTFGCAQNVSDSERITAMLESRGMVKAKDLKSAEHVIINTCMIREMAENRVYGLVHNLKKLKLSAKGRWASGPKIVLTGCMVGMAVRDKTGKFLRGLKKKMPAVDEFLPIEEVGFDHPAVRTDSQNAWVPVSNGCNNFCTFCVVPFSRGREVSRPYEEILAECRDLVRQGYKKITLLGMNVNSYGADLVVTKKGYKLSDGRIIKPVMVKHLGRLRIPTLFPYLISDICKIDGIKLIDFISSNPWDFSDELINVIARNPQITRSIHLPVQSGSNSVLKRMNRWYTVEQYIALISKLKSQISNLKISTDIIVGFCGETEKEFQETVDLAKKAGFFKAYVAMYSDRPLTAAHKALKDNVLYPEKKKRWQVLEDLINKPNLKKHE